MWRYSYDIPPPKISINNKYNPIYNEEYQYLTNDNLPLGESLKMTYQRIEPYWENTILSQLTDKNIVLICGHSNSIRSIIKNIEKIDKKKIEQIKIPNCIPIIYNFDKNMNVVKKKILY